MRECQFWPLKSVTISYKHNIYIYIYISSRRRKQGQKHLPFHAQQGRQQTLDPQKYANLKSKNWTISLGLVVAPPETNPGYVPGKSQRDSLSFVVRVSIADLCPIFILGQKIRKLHYEPNQWINGLIAICLNKGTGHCNLNISFELRQLF